MDRSGPGRKKGRKDRALAGLTQGALIAALYLVLTLATSFMSFSVVQLRLAEALAALPALFPSAVAGVFLGCLLANLLNPQPLGLVDVLAGSGVSLLAAFLTWRLARPWRLRLASEMRGETSVRPGRPGRILQQVIPLLPPLLLNALVVGSYLPFLLQSGRPSAGVILASIGSLLLSQALVLFGLGLPLLLALRKTPWARRVYLTEGEDRG